MRELAALDTAANYCAEQGLPFSKDLRTLYVKLTSKPKSVGGAPIAQIEAALIEHSDGRVIRATGGPAFWTIQSRRYADYQATPSDAELVAKWLAKQAWCEKGRYTVANLWQSWPTFLAKAKLSLTMLPSVAKEEVGRVYWEDEP